MRLKVPFPRPAHISFIEFCNKLTIKNAVYLSAKCWEEISSISLCRAWNKLLLSDNEADSQSPSEELSATGEELNQLGINESEMEEWLTADQDLTGVQELSDGEILDLVKESTSPQDDTDEEEEMERAVSHSDAEQCFDTCLKWLEQQQEATPMNLMLLGNLHSLASRKRHSSLKQRKITSFCSHKKSPLIPDTV